MKLLFLLFLAVLAILPQEIVQAIGPLFVFLAIEVVRKFAPSLPGWVIISIVLPILALVSSWIVTAINPEASFLVQVLLGLSSIFVAELIKQLQQGNNKPVGAKYVGSFTKNLEA
jgi:hypothetical protein